MSIDVVSAYDGAFIKSLKKQNRDEAMIMLEKAHQRFLNKSLWLKPYQRIDILNKLSELVSKEADVFATLIAKEGGKPLIDAKVEVARAIEGIKLATKEIMYVMRGEEIPMGYSKASEDRLAFTIYEPIGVVLAISAFNHPLNLIVHQIIPAIAVGCPVIIKPASKTPLCCLRFVELLYEAGLHQEFCYSLVCDNIVTEALVTDNRIGFLSFIGSSQIGWYLAHKLAPGTRYALEHGGAAPVIIDKNLDKLDTIITSLVKGGFYHAGQVCISTQRVYVPQEELKNFTEKLVVATKNLKVGDPSLLDTEVGPLISTKEVDRIATWVRNAIEEGATLLCGGKKISDTLYEPTILLEPNLQSKVSLVEVFGPVVCVYGYSTMDEAVKKANAPNLPFQAAVFSNNLNSILHLFHNIDANAIIVNDHSAFRVDWMPFAGRKSTGYGIGGIAHTMKEMLTHKMVVIKTL